MRKRSYGLVLHPNYVPMAVSVLVIVLALFSDKFASGSTVGHGQVVNEAVCYSAIVVAAVALLRSCMHYSIHKEGIVRRFLWIPLYQISWDNIMFLTYAQAWKDKELQLRRLRSRRFLGVGKIEITTISDSGAIFFTKTAGLTYDPKKEYWCFFKMRNPFSAFKIRVPSSQKALSLKVLEKHCPFFENSDSEIM